MPYTQCGKPRGIEDLVVLVKYGDNGVRGIWQQKLERYGEIEDTGNQRKIKIDYSTSSPE